MTVTPPVQEAGCSTLVVSLMRRPRTDSLHATTPGAIVLLCAEPQVRRGRPGHTEFGVGGRSGIFR